MLYMSSYTQGCWNGVLETCTCVILPFFIILIPPHSVRDWRRWQI